MLVGTAAHFGVSFAYTGYTFHLPVLTLCVHVLLVEHARCHLTKCLSFKNFDPSLGHFNKKCKRTESRDAKTSNN